jgi:RNA polymerase sigma-70 factor (ECF subfamily)
LNDKHDDLNSNTNAIGLKEMAEKLGDSCKSLIELLYFKGYTKVEVLEELYIPLGTIKTKNKTCIEQLRLALGV